MRLASRAIGADIRRMFVVLIAYWITYWLAIGPIVWLFSGGPPVLSTAQYATLITLNMMALASLLWMGWPRTVDRFAIPLAIALCTLAFLVEKAWFLGLGARPDATAGQLMHAHVLRQDFVLVLVLVAWQFRFRYALAYVAVITVVEALLVTVADLSNPLLAGITQRELIVRAVIFVLISYAIHWLVQRQREQQSELVAANARLTHYATTVDQLSASQERNRLARELHDTLSHSLSALTVQLEAVRSLWDVDSPAARSMLVDAQTTASKGLIEARQTLHALRAAPLETFGLSSALHELSRAAELRSNAHVSVHLPEVMPKLTPQSEHIIYRFAQEALENCVRHAAAQEIDLSLSQAHGCHVLKISDDGVGFDPESSSGLGVLGMHERAEALAGKLTITSSAGCGTVLALAWSDQQDG